MFEWPVAFNEYTEQTRAGFREVVEAIDYPTTADGVVSHDGSVATLEDWFDPKRTADDYVPTGWNPGGGPRPVRGHEFGLDLDAAERRALIAFLRTL